MILEDYTTMYVILYVLGFILSLFALRLFGKRMGFDYDPPHDGYHDDWDSNASAYTAFSVGWPLFWLINAIFGFGLLLKMLGGFIVNKKK